jgi:hypothetical protein
MDIFIFSCLLFLIIGIYMLFCIILNRLEDIEDKIDKLPHVTEQEEN